MGFVVFEGIIKVMRPMMPGIKMPRLPQVVGKMQRRDDSPPVEGLDDRSEFRPGYNPVTGLTDSFLLQLENSSFILLEDEAFILVY